MKSLRIVFAGTPEFACAHFLAILQSRHQVIAAYTQPDRPTGRGRKLKASPVKLLALDNNIPVFQPISFKNKESYYELFSLNADLMVVVAYGLILPQFILDAPKFGCINVHASILPRWRGAAPIQRAIEAGDTESGVTIIQMNQGLDTGDMLLKVSCPVNPNDTSSDLHDRLIDIGKPALIQVLDEISIGDCCREKQENNQACYAHKISKDEARVDWKKTAYEIERKILAFNPWPMAYTVFDDTKIRIWEAIALKDTVDVIPGTILKADKSGLDVGCSEGVLRIKRLQLAGGRAITVQDLLNGKKSIFNIGSTFT